MFKSRMLAIFFLLCFVQTFACVQKRASLPEESELDRLEAQEPAAKRCPEGEKKSIIQNCKFCKSVSRVKKGFCCLCCQKFILEVLPPSEAMPTENDPSECSDYECNGASIEESSGYEPISTICAFCPCKVDLANCELVNCCLDCIRIGKSKYIGEIHNCDHKNCCECRNPNTRCKDCENE